MLSPRDEVIEGFGRYFEQYALPRILGRVYGLLLITNEPCLGLDGIAEELGVSKASASTIARQLAGWSLIEKVSLPGDRRDYYRVSPDAHVQYLKTSLTKALGFSRLIERAAHLEDLTLESREKLERLEHLYEAISATIAEFFENYSSPTPAKPKARSLRPIARGPARNARPNGRAAR